MSQTQDLRSMLFAWLSVALGLLVPVAGIASITDAPQPSLNAPVLGLPAFASALNGVAVTGNLAMVVLSVGATLACLISWRLGRYGLTRAPVHEAQNDLLIQALNHIDLCIVIYDRDLRAVHWNSAMACTFPALLPELTKGATLPQLTEAFDKSSLLRTARQPDKAQEFAASIVRELRAGREMRRVVAMEDGRVFEVVEFAFGPDHFASVRKDVTQLQQQANQIRDQNVRLSSMNERMQHFAEMAAHDLRAPLLHQATLLTFIAEDLQAAHADVPPEIDEYLDLSRNALCRMQQLVEDLLEYARCDVTPETKGPVSLTERLAKVMELVNLPDGFSVTWPADLPQVQVPEAACDIVLRNLISNAIKHHDRSEGRIIISARTTSHTAYVSVADDGPGIPEAFQAKIFDPFHQVSVDSRKRGSGLGLAMVSRTVSTWNGDISLDCGPERGSTFSFSAPLATRDSRAVGVHEPDRRHRATG